MVRILKLVTGLLAAITLYACTGNFEKYNSDKTGFTEEQKEYDYNTFGVWLKVVQMGIYFNYDWGGGKNWTFQTMQNLSADMFCGYMHDFSPFIAGMGNSVYNLQDGWNTTMWDNTYGYIMTEIKNIEDYSHEKYPTFYAVAKILKVEVMHRVSDYYGPIIYSRFGESNMGAMPDSQKDVYYAFFRDLDEAIRLLGEYKGEETLARFDMIMPNKYRTYREWVRFANSLRLRLAIRIAMADPAKAEEEARKSIGHSSGMLEDDYEIVSVSTAGTGYSNPLGEISNAWGEAILNANMESILKGYQDPRLACYFKPATGQGYTGEYRGIRQGTGFNHQKYNEHSKCTVTQSSDAILMTPAEVWFLRAEAALRGWSDEDVEVCYVRGVKASFSQWRAEDADDYLQSESVAADFVDTFTPEYSVKAICKISPKWEEGVSDEVKLEKIITQKWIACFPEGCEAWAEQRRTGYPRLFPVLVNKSNGNISTQTMIRRLNFPAVIMSDNPTQYAALCEYLGGLDTGGTRLWWDTGRNFRH